jgi:tetrahydromethanopterin S-methyltransferase subunit F
MAFDHQIRATRSMQMDVKFRTNLICRDKPLDGCLSEKCIGISFFALFCALTTLGSFEVRLFFSHQVLYLAFVV